MAEKNLRVVLSFYFLILLFLPFAFTQVSVSLAPQGDNNASLIYPSELKDYSLTIKNDSQIPEENLTVSVSVSQGLSLKAASGGKGALFYRFSLLQPGESVEEHFTVMSKGFFSGTAAITVSPDSNSSEILASAVVESAQSPLSYSVAVEGFSGAAEKGTASFTLENVSGATLFNVRAEVLPEGGVVPEGTALEAPRLEPLEKLSGKQVFSSASAGASGNVSARVLFEDSGGRHVLEKTFSQKGAGRDFLAAFLVLAVALLVFASVYMRKQKNSPKKKHEGGH